MDATEPGLQCGWAGCLEEFDDEPEWIKHASIHVFTLKPNERTPWLGLPEHDPDRHHVPVVNAPFADNQSDGEDGDYDDDDRAFSQINALSSPASTPPQVGLPDSPDLSEKINGPSASMATSIEPLSPLRSPDEPKPTLSHRTSGSADDVEAELMPTSPTPSVNTSRDVDSSQENLQYLLPHPTPAHTQSQFPSVNVNRFRRGTFQIRSPAQTPLSTGLGMTTSQSQGRPIATQTLQSSGSSQVGALGSQSQTDSNDMSWLNTQAFRPPESQDLSGSD